MSVTSFLQSIASASPLRGGARSRKGDLTRAAILDNALGIARRDGIEGLTIGGLAEQMRMSKSGVFAHFGSREELQLAVIDEYGRRFVDEVLRPAVKKPRGLPRLRALLDNWLRVIAREVEQGCLMISGSVEYDDRPGPLRDAMVTMIGAWNAELTRAIEAARDAGHLRADVDARQVGFEIHGALLAFHQSARLLRASDSARRARTALARLLEGARVDAEAQARRPPRPTARGQRTTATSLSKAPARRAASRGHRK